LAIAVKYTRRLKINVKTKEKQLARELPDNTLATTRSEQS
jgi:hypothetical protein